MKSLLMISICLFVSVRITAQNKCFTVVNSEINALPYANIKLINSERYTFTDNNGKFCIDLSLEGELIEINYVGYSTLSISTERLKFYPSDTIFLQSSSVELNEITVNPINIRKEYKLGEWKDKDRRFAIKSGIGEVATLYKIESDNGYILKQVRFYVKDFQNSENIKVRLCINPSIVQSKKTIPSDSNLLKMEYILEVDKKNNWYTFDLKDNWQVMYCKDVFIKLQFLNIDYVEKQGWIDLGINRRENSIYSIGNSTVFKIGGFAWWSKLWNFHYPYNLKQGIEILK